MPSYVLGVAPATTSGWALIEVVDADGPVIRAHGQCQSRGPAIQAVVSQIKLLIPPQSTVVLALAGTRRRVGKRWEVAARHWKSVIVEQETWRLSVFGRLPDKPLRQDQWQQRAVKFIAFTLGLQLDSATRWAAEGILVGWYQAEVIKQMAPE